MIEDENNGSDDLLTCPSCGEKSPKRRKRCPNCGAALRPDDSGPSALYKEHTAENVVSAHEAEKPYKPADDPRLCGRDKPDGGYSAYEERRTVTEAKLPDDDASYERTYGGTPFDQRSGVKPSRSDDSYDRAYGGTPFDQRPSGAFVGGGSHRAASDDRRQDDVAEPSDGVKKKRKVSLIAYCVSVALACVGLIFFFTPFITIKTGSVSVSQSSFGTIAALFGGTNSIGVYGASVATVMFVGGAYLGYILSVIFHGVALGLSFGFVKKNEKPVSMGISALLIAIIGIELLAFGVEAMSDIRSHSIVDSGYIGTIGMGVCAVLGGIATLFGYIYSKNTYPRGKTKLKGVKQIMSVTSVILAVVCLMFDIIPALDITAKKDREITVNCGESGRAAVVCDTVFDYGEYGGVTVFKLEGLEEGGEYSIRIKFDEDIGVDTLDGSLWLCYYDDVSHSTIREILQSEILIENQTTTPDSATLTFTNDFGGREVAAVTGFIANQSGNLYLDYAFFDRSVVLGNIQ